MEGPSPAPEVSRTTLVELTFDVNAIVARELGSAAARPRTTAFGEDAYADMWTEAAALLQSIVKSHALVDGNKRSGWLATVVFLELNSVATGTASNGDVYELVVGLAGGHDDVNETAALLRRS